MAAILYPMGYPTFNYIDDVDVSYETTFTGGAYLVLNCYTSSSKEITEWVYAQNPSKLCFPDSHTKIEFKNLHTIVNSSGSYLWLSIGSAINSNIPLVFPASCWFDLGPSIGGAPSPNHVYQGNFTMISTSAPTKTWALTTTYFTTGFSTTMTATSSSTEQVTPPGRSLSSLSTGAKAGIGIGAAAGLLIILGIISLFIRMRRREARMKAQLAVFQRERDMEGTTQKAELDAQIPANRKIQAIVAQPELQGSPAYELSGQNVHSG